MKTGRLAMLVLVLFIFGCQKEDNSVIAPNAQNYLSAFRFLKVLNPELSEDLTGNVMEQRITLQAPAGLYLNNLIASFDNEPESNIYVGNNEPTSRKTNNNFSAPLVYRVLASNESANYKGVEIHPMFPELDQALETVMQQYQVPGLTVAIVKNEKLVFAKGYGYANKETHQPVDNESLFRIASISKPITAVAILKLAQDGKLKLSDKVFGSAGILRNEFGNVPAGSNLEAITVQNLLEHKSGWINQPNDPMMANLNLSHQELIADIVQHRPLAYSPGSTYYYSNFGYCVLGRIIEKVSGKTYSSYVQSAILQPLGIIDMRLASNTQAQSALNEVTYYQENDNPYAYNINRMDAHGGWLATATDLMRLMVHIDRNTKAADIVSSDMLNQTYMGYYNWFHTGSFPGTSAILTRLDDEYSFAVLANTRNNDQPFAITDALYAAIKEQLLLKTNWPEADLFTQNRQGTQ
ncbi:serine hydrolase domain-containing protein [Adhaeribacter radiodurans]|uniref:Beta-lactamase family protein n=1 Tax=Adhaeribacter radiodurans TaxID=2745197 RepID=A0A7L7LC82_9BACT|nr:serine hydrolase domain-containing protein [Adhaeribacter radiodurans]QMU30452.1 beta-lactamase family protein [Adhaeribacter radiodurans]